MLISLAALLLAAADPAAAAPAPPAAAAAEKAAKPAKDASQDRICWSETPLGTRFSHRVCATRAELEARQRNTRDFVNQAQSGQMK